jgi:hypothetical protein
VPNPVSYPYTTWQPDGNSVDTNHPIDATDFMAVGTANDLGGWIRWLESNVREENLNKQWERWLGVNTPYSPSPNAPVFISGTSFSLTGDWTSAAANYPIIAVVGRRIKATIGGGDAEHAAYGTITGAVFAGGITTVTVAMDSAALDAGITEVAFGVPSPGGSLASSSFVYSGVSAGTDAYTVTLTPVPTALSQLLNRIVVVQFSNANTGITETLAPNSLAATPIMKWRNGVLVALVAGDIPAGYEAILIYDGTQFELINPASNGLPVIGGTITLGVGSAYTGTTVPIIKAYAQQQVMLLAVSAPNPGTPVTVNLNGIGVATLKKFGATDLAAGDLSTGQVIAVAYDGTNLQVLSPLNFGGLPAAGPGSTNPIINPPATINNLQNLSTSLTALPTTPASIALTAPASGGPFRLQVEWFCALGPNGAALNSPVDCDFCISDGTNRWAKGSARVIIGDTGSASGSGLSPGTAYANGATVTISLLAIRYRSDGVGAGTGNIAALSTSGGGIASTISALFIPSN